MSTENKSTVEKTETTPTPQKMITLKSSDGECYEVEEKVAIVSHTIKNLVDDGCTDDPFIPIPNVSGPILAKVIEYSRKHAESATETDAEVKAFDAEFVNVEDATLFELILAANYLNIKSLLDLTCQTVAEKIKDMSVEDVRALFNITSDFTEEEEAAIRNENAWAFE